MNRRLPPEAFSIYLGLGHERSYEAVARHYGVSKRAVTKLAARENWQERVRAADEATRAKVEEKVQETLEEMNERHLKTVQFIQRKALEALRATAISSGMDAVRALTMGLEKERLIRGEPTSRAQLDTEAVIKREYERWLLKPGETEDWDLDGEDEEDEEAELPAGNAQDGDGADQ